MKQKAINKPKKLIDSLLYKIDQFIVNNPSGVLLILISLVLAMANYKPGVYLTGWDTLHPEFNYTLYWERILGGVWQDHQGLGAVATQAHASEIPRVLILMVLDVFLANNQVRFMYMLSMLIIGPLGMYFFLKLIVLKGSTRRAKELGAFAGGLLYLLNLGVLQHFYVPLEMFLTHFGFLPWILLLATQYLQLPRDYVERKRTRKILFLFVLFSFIASSQAHTPTLFYAFILNFVIFLLAYSSFTLIKRDTLIFKRSFLLFALMLLVNLYWILPNLYFAINRGHEIQQSKIHQLFSQEAFLQNKEFGNIKDAAIIKNFLFNWGEHTGFAEFGDLLDEWKSHQKNPYVLTIGYASFALVLLGALISILRKSRVAIAILAMFVVSLFFLFNVNPPFGFIFLGLQKYLPLFREAFRFPFTKFSIILAFTYGVFFGVFFASLGDLISKIRSKFVVLITYMLLTALVFIALFYYMMPAFFGNYISPTMKVDIPQRYFELFDYMDRQDDYGRVANLPMHSFWGWAYHNWDESTQLGYQGAGFLWFGIKQPLLDREFDRWNLLNEGYYREMSNAIYSEDVDQVERVLEKYKVRWILLDKSILTISANPKMLFYDQMDAMFEESGKISLEKDFGSGLFLYAFAPKKPFVEKEEITDFVYSTDSIFKEYDDPIYEEYGNYVEAGDKAFPFVGVTSEHEDLKTDFVSSDDEYVYLKANRPVYLSKDSRLEFTSQFDVSYKLQSNNLDLKLSSVNGLLPDETFNLSLPFGSVVGGSEAILVINKEPFVVDSTLGSSEFVSLGTILLNPSEEFDISLYRSDPADSRKITTPQVLEVCSDVGRETTYSVRYVEDGFELGAKDVVACVTTNLKNLAPLVAHEVDLVGVNFDYESFGADPDICLLDEESGLCLNPPRELEEVYSFIDGSRVGEYFLRFFADGGGTSNEVGVHYRNIYVSFPQKVASGTFGFDAANPTQLINLEVVKLKKDPDYSGAAAGLLNEPRLCMGEKEFVDAYVEDMENYLRYESYGESLCDSFKFPLASHSNGQVLEIRSRNIEGVPLRLCLTNEYSKRCEIYVSLHEGKEFMTQYFLVPAVDNEAGYTLNISNLTFGKSVGINDLEYVALTPVPYDLLREVHNEPTANINQTLITNNQAIEVGWRAMCGFWTCDAQHVKVNNWANGWLFEGDVDVEDVRIVYQPQFLEYIGFIALLGAFVWVLKFNVYITED